MIRSYILRGSNFLLPFKMFYQQQTLAISYFLFFFFGWRNIADFILWLTLWSILWPPGSYMKKQKLRVRLWNGYERSCAADV